MMLTLARHQQTLGHDSTVGIQREGWVSNKVLESDLHLIIKPLESSIDIPWLKAMYQVAKSHDIKLIHSHEFAMNLHATLLSQISGIPSITTVHGKKYYSDKWQRRLTYRYISKHSNLVAVSKDLKQFLIDEIGIKEESVEVLPNGIDIDKFKPQQTVRADTRQELGIKDDQILIGAIGNLYPVKGHSYLLDAASLVCKRHPEAIFMIAGRGELESDLRAQAKNLGIENNLLFLGFRDDVHRLLQAMDIFAMSSLSEGLPVSILEAMASRTPIVATEVGGIPEVIVQGKTGYLAHSQSADSLAKGLIKCVGEQALTNEMIGRAYELVVSKHSLLSMLNEYEKLYKRLM